MCYDVITTGDMLKYYANYTGKNWISDTAMKIFHTREDNKELESVIKELKLEMKEAYILEDNTTLSLDDLRTFYHENKNLKSQNLPLIHENQALTKENEALKERVEFLEKERSALIYNMDHAYNLGDGKFLTLDDLCTFYEDNKNIHDVVQQQHNRILLLGLELKALQKPKDETFATKTKEEFEKRAEAAALKAAENMKFDTYTEGFRKGFDMGYEKAKDQYYE
jgi:regulator of replication initiation timing